MTQAPQSGPDRPPSPGKDTGRKEGESAARTDSLIFKHVLCATDFSDAAAAALEVGVMLAQACKAEIRVVHMCPSPGPAGCGMAHRPATDQKSRGDLIENLDRSAQSAVACGLATRSLLLQGDPPEAILREAGDFAADLIVMGQHGPGAPDFRMVTERVLKDARCPVVAARSFPRPRGEGPRHVLCALDLGATAEATLAHAVAMANALEGELLVLYVAASRGIEVARNALAALVAKAPVASRGLQERVVTGVPYVEILAAARESGSDLVVVGSHGGGVGDRPFLGSTTLHLFRHSQCPVFVVPVAISRRREAARQVPPSALDVTERPDVAARLRSCQVRLERRRPSGE